MESLVFSEFDIIGMRLSCRDFADLNLDIPAPSLAFEDTVAEITVSVDYSTEISFVVPASHVTTENQSQSTPVRSKVLINPVRSKVLINKDAIIEEIRLYKYEQEVLQLDVDLNHFSMGGLTANLLYNFLKVMEDKKLTGKSIYTIIENFIEDYTRPIKESVSPVYPEVSTLADIF